MNTHGKIVYERGPGFAFDFKAKEGICKLIENRYYHALLAGKILSTYDLEGGYLYKENVQNGDYIHLDLINRVSYYDSIKQLCKGEKILMK